MDSSIPTFKSSYQYEGKTILVAWFDLIDKHIPDILWQQVYAIGDLDGKVPVVFHSDRDVANLPGGHTEQGESIDETIKREMIEETNLKVIWWKPLGYQKLTDPDGTTVNQLRVYAKLEKIDDFVNDPGGLVTGYKLIKLNELNKNIRYERTGDHLELLASRYFV